MTNINRQPSGILGFLGLKNGGRFPQVFGDTLAPTWDLSELYLNSTPLYTDVTSTTNAAGYEICFAPPPGEIWYVMDGGVFIFANAGIIWEGYLARSSPNNAVQVPLSERFTCQFIGRVSMPYTRPIVLAPGENLGFTTGAISGGAANVYAAIRYAALTV